MHIHKSTAIILLIGLFLVAWGYHLLAVPPDTGFEEMIIRARNGMMAAVGGGTLILLWLAKR